MRGNHYPQLVINKKRLIHNIKEITTRCSSQGVMVTGVIKGCGGNLKIAEAMISNGCHSIGSSRVDHLRRVKGMNFDIKTMLLRIPMISEVDEMLKWTDISLNSEKKVIEQINKACKIKGIVHEIILMIELGDLREGVYDRKELIDIVDSIENEYTSVKLVGIGTNLGCYGSIKPTVEKMNELIEVAEFVEKRTGKGLKYISGSATSSLPLVYNGEMPKKINHLRIGEGLLLNMDLPYYHNFNEKTLMQKIMTLNAEIIEVKIKPTYPIGEISVDAFGYKPIYEDRGLRKRAIIALGRQDVIDPLKLIPHDDKIEIIGSSSDHLMVDIGDSENEYEVGDIISFDVFYQVMLQMFMNEEIEKNFEI